MLQNFSLHVENTFLRFNMGTGSPGDGSKSRESTNSIAFCVAVFSLEPSSRIWKRQNFLAIFSCCVPIGSNLLNSQSWVCLLSASYCVRKSFSVAGRWLAVSITSLDSSSVAWTQQFWILIKYCCIPRNIAKGPPVLFDSPLKEFGELFMYHRHSLGNDFLRKVHKHPIIRYIFSVFSSPERSVPYIDTWSSALPFGTSPCNSHCQDDICKSTRSISDIDRNPYSSVVISSIVGILPFVIMKTTRSTDLVIYHRLSHENNLRHSQIGLNAQSSKELSVCWGSIWAIVAK